MIILTWYALNPGIAVVADRTLANWIVIVNVAQGIPAARIAGDTWIYAERINALLIARAFAIRVTLWPMSWQWSNWSCEIRNCM